ncbi:MAG: 16S rRNA (cytidine(1402)-2'-O)-methyltransferase [Deltaproteobacteria bacterium]|nr:16S rRNA (cytidine(1402)-2'-O)-methyltransferase [Deltaproteobacteria bacterium]
MEVGTLYLVATPIGNLEDLSERARRVLSCADLIAAEDTRVTRKLLSHLGVHRPLVSLHAHSSPARIAALIERLGSGQSLAVVTDAGAPGVSDPGAEIVAAAAQGGFPVVPVPGPSAVTTAVMAAGIPSRGFHFVGFLPRAASKRRRELEALRTEPCAIVLFEAPDRTQALLRLAAEVLGADRPAAVCRELTKLHEQIVRGPLGGLATSAIPARGEVTVVIGPGERAPVRAEPATVEDRIAELLDEGLSVRDAADRAAAELGVGRSQAYRVALAQRSGAERRT